MTELWWHVGASSNEICARQPESSERGAEQSHGGLELVFQPMGITIDLHPLGQDLSWPLVLPMALKPANSTGFRVISMSAGIDAALTDLNTQGELKRIAARRAFTCVF